MLSVKAKTALEVAVASKKLGEEIAQAIDDSSAGVVPAGSISNSELATDVKVGSLASLTTTIKTSVVEALNEVDSHADAAAAAAATADGKAVVADGKAVTADGKAVAAQSTADAAIPKTNVSANLAGVAPTQAQMVAGLGAAAAKAGVVAVMTDSSDATKVYVCASNGVAWAQVAVVIGV